MDDAKYYKRTILKEKLFSTHLQEEKTLTIFLPPGYQELLSYSVVYCQDGDDFFNFGRIATQAMKLILDEGMEPCIIIGVSVDRKRRKSQYHPDGSQFLNYSRFFTEEFLPYVEDRFAIRPDPDERILAGDSLAGTISLHLALDFPDLFHRVISFSGAFYPPTEARIQREQDLSWLTLYNVIGLQEDKAKTEIGIFDFLTMNRNCRDLLEVREANLIYLEKEGQHVWGFWQNELGAALQYFLGTTLRL